jgi:hypothetical protein
MIAKVRVFSLALWLAIAAITTGVAKAQDAQPMNEVPLGSSTTTTSTKTGGAAATSDGVVSGIDGSGEVVTSTDPAATTGPEAVTFDGTYIWIARQFSDSVTRVRASDGAVSGTFAVGKRPVALLYAGGYVWVANLLSDNVVRLSPSTGAIAGTFTVGKAPGGLAFDGTNIWVARPTRSPNCARTRARISARSQSENARWVWRSQPTASG